MSPSPNTIYSSVEGILREIALGARSDLDPYGIIFNERYLHHEFSHRYQRLYPASNPLMPGSFNKGPEADDACLHPEWPTRKPGGTKGRTGGAVYRGVEPDKKGSAGHIDFAVGPYRQPWLAIEFKLAIGWVSEGVGFDLVKLMDPRNRFEKAMSFNLILRKKLSVKYKGIHRGIGEANADALRRLTELHRTNPHCPDLWYFVAEIAPNARRFFQYRHTGSPTAKGTLEVAEIRGVPTPAWNNLVWGPAKP